MSLLRHEATPSAPADQKNKTDPRVDTLGDPGSEGSVSFIVVRTRKLYQTKNGRP